MGLGRPSKSFTITTNTKEPKVEFPTVEYEGEPYPSLEWYDPQDMLISDSDRKFPVKSTQNVTILTIRYPKLTDTGNYTLKVHNVFVEKTIHFQLIVEGESTSKA